MTFESYKETRGKMLDEMQAMIDEGKLADVKGKKEEVEKLDREFEEMKNAKAELDAIRGAAHDVPKIVREETKMGAVTGENLDASSHAYKQAFFKHLLDQDNKMTRMEAAAFTHTTSDDGAPLPTTMLNNIWDLVSGQHAIMGDITIYRTGTIMEVVKHTTIVQGKAKKVAEAAANDDEKNTMVKVTLSGNDFSKHVYISYAEATMSIDALEQYLTNEIATGIGEAMAEDAISTIESGIAATNKITTAAAGTVTFGEVAKLFGTLKRVGSCVAYMTRGTLYDHLVSMTDTTGRPIFQPDAQAAGMGVILGATVKIEDAVEDGKILVGDPKRMVYNMVQDVMVETDKDIVNHKYVYSGYARGQGALIDDRAFAELTVKADA